MFLRISIALCLILLFSLTTDLQFREHGYSEASEKAIPVLRSSKPSSEEPLRTSESSSEEPLQTSEPSSEEPLQTSEPSPEESSQTPAPTSPEKSLDEDEDDEDDEDEEFEVEELELKGKKKAIQAYWEKVPGASGYELWYSTSPKFKGKKVKHTKKAKLTIGKVKTDRVYFVKVRAYKIKEGQKKYGYWSEVQERKIITEKRAYAKLRSVRKKYPEGKSLTNNNFSYLSNKFGLGYGCYGFAAKVSDTVFGKGQSYKTHSSFKKDPGGR